MTAIQRFYDWREQKLVENPDWSEETRDWFLGMYMQTYPARTPSIVTELFDFFEGRTQEDEQRELPEPVDDSDEAVHPRKNDG